MTSQADLIEVYLNSGHELTPIQALEMFGCFRLAARIKDLRERGIPIETLDREANAASGSPLTGCGVLSSTCCSETVWTGNTSRQPDTTHWGMTHRASATG